MAKRWNERVSDLENAISRLKEAIKDSEQIQLSTLKDGDVWIKMIEDRNLTSHIYSQSMADTIYDNITKKYLNELVLLLDFLKRCEV